MENNSGIRKLLNWCYIYSFFQDLIGGEKVRKWLAQSVYRVQSGDTIIDLGCGPGDILRHLPENIKYIGIDINQSYIKTAQKKYGYKGQFIEGDALYILENEKVGIEKANLVLCIGFLHHLRDEEVLLLLKSIKKLLKEEGRCIFLEPTFLLKQNNLSKWIMKMDRGKNIRSERSWKSLVGKVFPNSSTYIIQGLILIPYIHILMECFNDKEERGKK